MYKMLSCLVFLVLTAFVFGETIVTTPIGVFSGHEREVTSISYSQNGSSILSTSGGSPSVPVFLREANTGSVIREFLGHTYDVTCASFSHNELQIVSSGWDRTARLWDTNTGVTTRLFNYASGLTCGVQSSSFSPDGSKILLAIDKKLAMYDKLTGTLIREYTGGHTNIILSATFTSDGTQILSGGRDSAVCLWDAETGVLLQTYAFPNVNKNSAWVYSIVCSRYNNTFLIGCGDFTAKICDITTGLVLKTFSGHGSPTIPGWVYDAVFSPDESKVLTGSVDGTAKLWDSTTGILLITFQHPSPSIYSTEWVTAVGYSPLGNIVATGDTTGTVRIWSISGTSIADFNNDGDVDQSDMSIFDCCFTGSLVPYNPVSLPDCCTLEPVNGKIPADFDNDGDVDHDDFGVIQRFYNR